MRVAVALILFVLVCLPGVAAAEDRGLKLPTMVASAAAAADWASTYHALSNYQLRESNPLLRPFESSPTQVVVMGALMDGVAFSAWNMTVGQKYPKAASAGLWAMAAFRSYLVVHNIRNMRRAPARDPMTRAR